MGLAAGLTCCGSQLVSGAVAPRDWLDTSGRVVSGPLPRVSSMEASRKLDSYMVAH